MTPDTTISITLLISVISIMIAVVNSVRAGRKDTQAEIDAETRRRNEENARQMDIEKNFVKINVKLDDFCDTSKKLMQENKEKTDQLRQVTERLAIISERCDTLFKYKDDHEKRLVALEKRDD